MAKKNAEKKLAERMATQVDSNTTGGFDFLPDCPKEPTLDADEKRGPGRPKKDKLPDYNVSLKFPADWESRIRHEADIRGMSITAFIRSCVSKEIF